LTHALHLSADSLSRSLALGWRGYCLWRLGAFQKAQQDLKESLRLNPKGRFFEALSAQALLDAAHPRAYETYCQALKHPEPLLAPFYAARARLHEKRKRWELAYEDFEKAFLLDASLTAARRGLKKIEKNLSLKIWLPSLR
jgi:tetratricopeptide (TPR) repeat protein